MPAEVALPALQRWMQAVVVHPGSIDDAVTARDAVQEIARVEDVVLPNAHLTAKERVGIYQGMYLLRMEEALQTDYPALQHFLGPDAFFALVRDYVQTHPSRSYSLNPLGAHLPAFLAAGGGTVPRRGFCVDLAALELALTEAFDARETPALSADEIAAVPADAWEHARLAPVASLRLLALRYPASAWLDTLEDPEHRHPETKAARSWAVVYRREWSVYRQTLTRPAHDLLADLVKGTRLGDAITAALAGGGRRAPSEHELFRWFREWAAGGLFRAVSID